MDVVCFSFDCYFNDDGSSNCSTIDTKYADTTTSKPNPLSTPLPIPPASHRTETPPASPTTHDAPTTRVPTPSHSLTTHDAPNTRVPTPSHSLTTHDAQTTRVPIPSPSTTNISTSHPPMRHDVTSPSTPGSADGKSIYIPCSVVGFAVVVFLLVSIGIIRRHRNRRQSSDDRQPLDPECDLTFEDPQFLINIQSHLVQPATSSSNTDPTFSDVPLSADIDDTEEIEIERIDFIQLSSEDSDDLETAPKVDVDDVIFDRSTVRNSQREQGSNNPKVV